MMRTGMRRDRRSGSRHGKEQDEWMEEEAWYPESGESDAAYDETGGESWPEGEAYAAGGYADDDAAYGTRGYADDDASYDTRGYADDDAAYDTRGYADDEASYDTRGYADDDAGYGTRRYADDDAAYGTRRYADDDAAYEDWEEYEDREDYTGRRGYEHRGNAGRRGAGRGRDRETPTVKKSGFRWGWLIPLALAAVCAVSSFQFFRQLWIYEQAKSEYAGLDSLMELWEPAAASEQETETAGESAQESPYPLLNIDYEALKSINSEFVGVIYLPVLNVKYPIAQASDNTKYLSTTFEGTSNASGCIFLDCAATPDFGDNNTFIFGHNMKNETMFGSLKEFIQNESLCDENPYIYIYQETQVLIYRIFAYYTISVQDDVYNDFSGEDGYDAYVADAITHSSYKLSDAANEEIGWSERPRLLTLSTCYGTGHVYNFVVQAALVGTEAPAAAGA